MLVFDGLAFCFAREKMLSLGLDEDQAEEWQFVYFPVRPDEFDDDEDEISGDGAQADSVSPGKSSSKASSSGKGKAPAALRSERGSKRRKLDDVSWRSRHLPCQPFAMLTVNFLSGLPCLNFSSAPTRSSEEVESPA
jgi:hypothetical protein